MNPAEIHFFSETNDFNLEDHERIHKWLIEVCYNEGKELSFLNYIFCSDDYLLNINKEYLDHDYYTDIISFPMKTDPIEGDIFISVDRVRENAKDLEIDFSRELYRVIVHGLLHFVGYDDHKEEEKLIMREKEDKYLSLLHQ